MLGGDTVETSVNTYLVNTGARLVLIDTGAAGLFAPTLGNLLANMNAAPAASKGVFQGAMGSVNPCVAAGKLKPFEGTTELTPRPSPSHSTATANPLRKSAPRPTPKRPSKAIWWAHRTSPSLDWAM